MFKNVFNPGLQFRVLANLSITLVVEAKYSLHQSASQKNHSTNILQEHLSGKGNFTMDRLDLLLEMPHAAVVMLQRIKAGQQSPYGYICSLVGSSL